MGRTILSRVSVVLLVIFTYLLLHEGGHALASICFGNFDWSRSDFLGLAGSPHSGIRLDVELEPWQKAVQSIAGPLLPVLAGWVLFLAWRSARGKRIRFRSRFGDEVLSITILTLAVSSLGLLVPMAGWARDADYSGFIKNVPVGSWQANTALLLVVLTSMLILVSVVRHLVELGRRSRRSPIAVNSRGE